MKQDIIYALLVEAASPNCTKKRRLAIQCELTHAVYNGRDGAFVALLDNLFFQCYRNQPDILPNLFPVFAALCGDRDKERITASIHWDIVRAQTKK